MTDVQALTFDTYGTLVDWRSSVLEELTSVARRHGVRLDAERFLTEWKTCYREGMDRVDRGEWPWTTVDQIYARRLAELVETYGLKLDAAAEAELNRVWWRLRPWPDTVGGLTRLRRRVVISPLSNASFAGMVHLARFAGLPWDCVITAENARAYKPNPKAYRTAMELLGLAPAQVMMVAAHNYDLHAARALGMRTAFIPRPTEYGPGQTTDLAPDADWDVVAPTVEELARALGA
jgi:2-haloacid dehalogenase